MIGRSLMLLAALSVLPLPLWAQDAGPEADSSPPAVWEPERPWEVIDVAIALDTSDSMEDLVEAARLKLWDVVSDLSTLEPQPLLRVALLTYGYGSCNRGDDCVAIQSDFSQDIDGLAEQLFELPCCQGGLEYVGRAVQSSLEGLAWTESEDALKLILVAGNERADQDPEVSPELVGDLVRDSGVFVQLLYWGHEGSKDAESWRQLAELTEGEYAAIDRRTAAVQIESPADEELAELGAALSRTYIPLGEEGAKRRQSLLERDAKALEVSKATAASRAEAKARARQAAGWDLVEAVERGEVDLYEMDEAELPAAVRELSLGERAMLVEKMRLERQELQARIEELAAERRQHLEAEMQARGIDPTTTFEATVLGAIRERAEEKGFEAPEED